MESNFHARHCAKEVVHPYPAPATRPVLGEWLDCLLFFDQEAQVSLFEEVVAVYDA
jgi:hypothetical protein